MDIPKNFDPATIEDKWYRFWNEGGYFRSVPDEREAYTIVIPPPNVTGVLHMGHMLNNTIQDVLVRKKRMEGRNACWVPGTDHASIATEAKVVQKLASEGVNKRDLSREEFLEHCWEWTHKHGGVILGQLKKLGASCDWDRTVFTMDEDYYQSVIDVFVDLYEKGKIYQGVRMVNWDPQALTALSDEEVIYKEVNSKLYHVRYRIEGEQEELTIATTRPETILGDTAICVHPEDERYKHLLGKKAIVPMVERSVPVIADDHVDPEFGTGCLKITPAHDENDHAIGQRHGLEVIEILNDDGTLNQKAGSFVGEDRAVAREKIARALRKTGELVKEEDIVNKVGYSERTDAVIEPKLSLQWFCSMKELARPALENVMNDSVRFYPAKFRNTYKYWMENIRDWCISRQLWWGHRIPAYYFGKGDNEFVVARNETEALEKAREKSGNKDLREDDLRQEEDVLDTWFSSWIWPIAVFNGFQEPDNEELKYYYPTNDLVTAPEIMFFWVARMIMSGYEYMGERPFENVYYTGIVRDKLGRKMSKSLGNSPDPIELIRQYSADGVRVGMLLSSPAGNDLLFDKQLCNQGRNFANKIWNALRLVKGWEVDDKAEQPEESGLAVQWFGHKLNEAITVIEDHYGKFRMSDALMTTYKLVWDDLCSRYLEIVKPDHQAPMDAQTYEKTIGFFEQCLKLAHPFMPFVTEELWHLIRDREEGEAIITSEWPKAGRYDEALLKEMDKAGEVITQVRKVRKENDIPQKQPLSLKLRNHDGDEGRFDPVLKKLAHLDEITEVEEKDEQAYSFIVGTNEYFLPLGKAIDPEVERKKIREELEYLQGFLQSVEKKLNNEGFLSNAPEQVVANEKKKKADAESKIRVLEEKLAAFQ